MKDPKMSSVAELLKKGAPAEPEGDESTDEAMPADDDGRALSDAVYRAVTERDPDAFHTALEAFVQHCQMGGGPASEPGAAEPPKKGGVAIVLGGH